jgi:hypothetical protein
MSKYDFRYPQEVTIANFQELQDRAREVLRKSSKLPALTLVTGVFVYLGVFLLFAVPFSRLFPKNPEVVLYDLLVIYVVALVSSLIFAFWFAERCVLSQNRVTLFVLQVYFGWS